MLKDCCMGLFANLLEILETPGQTNQILLLSLGSKRFTLQTILFPAEVGASCFEPTSGVRNKTMH